MRVRIQRKNEARSKDTIMAAAQDKKGNIHLYDCSESAKKRPVWKKVGVIETKKLDSNLTEVKYSPRSKSKGVFGNSMYTYSPDLTPHFKRKELLGRNTWDVQKAEIVVYPRSQEAEFDNVSISLLHDNDGIKEKDQFTF
jgi:hypothetical protein